MVGSGIEFRGRRQGARKTFDHVSKVLPDP
jgi:hypothetical protein